MDNQKKEQFKKHILSEISKTEQSIEGLKEFTKPIAPNVSLGRLTRMEALNEKGIREQNLRTEKEKLKKLKDTLPQIDDEDFGICKSCGQDIPTPRLVAVPHSKVCIQCIQKSKK